MAIATLRAAAAAHRRGSPELREEIASGTHFSTAIHTASGVADMFPTCCRTTGT